jgi:hypothetical protein
LTADVPFSDLLRSFTPPKKPASLVRGAVYQLSEEP